MEIWQTIPLFNNYLISNYGRLKASKRIIHNMFGAEYCNIEDRIIQSNKNKGYRSVKLIQSNNIFRTTLHRLVALHFVANPENKPCVNHIDGNKWNNNYTNLEWCTYSENTIHAFNMGLNSAVKLSFDDLDEIKNMHNKGSRNMNIAKKYKISLSTIHCILNNNYKRIINKP